ncbi:MAG: ABC transporter substrate-binding protein, partial [bacterium]|nr:ABC transporter substrate-binding protein [bacterium]
MLIKRILLLLPLLIIAFLFQSYFWVPTFRDQAKGSSKRLRQYIQGTIGDAQILNPALYSDASSGTIVNLVFEGLIDRDKDLKFRGRLAKSWEIYEEAYFVPRPGSTTAEAVFLQIERAHYQGKAAWLKNIKEIEIAGPREEKQSVTLPPLKKGGPPRRFTFTIAYPKRIKFTLKKVDQDLFPRLKKLIGDDKFADDPRPYIRGELPAPALQAALGRVNLTEHNPVIIFHLREGVRFHDGREFDSGDVRFTYNSIMDGRNISPRIPDYEPVKYLETPDLYTVKVVYKRLYSPAFGTWGMGILPEHLLNKNALAVEARRRGLDPGKFTLRDSEFNRNPVGTGPFVFREWRSDEMIRLVRNSSYWEGPPEYEEYIFRIIPDALTQEMAFYAGTLDSYGAGTHQVERLRKDTRFQVFSGLSFGFTYIGYNMRRKPFDDVRVRRALSMAIDTNQIHKYILNGEAEDITGPFVKQSDHYNKSVAPLPHDPKGAIRLLNRAGWKKVKGRMKKDGKPLQFTLLTNHGNEQRKAIAIVVQDAWKKIGVEVRIDTVEWAVFIKKYIHGLNFDSVILGWSLGLDPDLYQIWHSSQTNPGQLNFVGYQNIEADRLIVKIRQEYDLKKQIRYAHALHEIIYRDQPYTFLYITKWTALLDRKIVIREKGPGGKYINTRIEPTRTGNYTFD